MTWLPGWGRSLTISSAVWVLQTDIGPPQRPRLRIASRGKNGGISAILRTAWAYRKLTAADRWYQWKAYTRTTYHVPKTANGETPNPKNVRVPEIHCPTYKTRSSADADNRLDAFSGQSRPTNMVPFHMLHIVSLCNSNFVFKTF